MYSSTIFKALCYHVSDCVYLSYRSALHIAAATSNARALVLLVECGLPVQFDAKDNDGKTPLFKVLSQSIQSYGRMPVTFQKNPTLII